MNNLLVYEQIKLRYCFIILHLKINFFQNYIFLQPRRTKSQMNYKKLVGFLPNHFAIKWLPSMGLRLEQEF